MACHMMHGNDTKDGSRSQREKSKSDPRTVETHLKMNIVDFVDGYILYAEVHRCPMEGFEPTRGQPIWFSFLFLFLFVAL